MVGLVGPMNKIDDTLAPNKGFKMKDIKDFNAMIVLKQWIEFKKLIDLEKEESTRDYQGGLEHTIAMLESSNAKRPLKEATNDIYIYIYIGEDFNGKRG